MKKSIFAILSLSALTAFSAPQKETLSGKEAIKRISSGLFDNQVEDLWVITRAV